MDIGIVSLFPEMFKSLDYGMPGRAQKQESLKLSFWNPREDATDPHQTVDDRPYGGGPGMVMQVEPLRTTIIRAKQALGVGTKVIYLSPQGQLLEHTKVKALSESSSLILLCGRYEGIDERLIDLEVDEELSIGDYVLSGGELAAMTLIDAISRWLPGVLGHDESALQDSFVQGLLDCPHYTRPEQAAGLNVPEVLLSGNHRLISRWRLKQALGRTWLRRPDLLAEKTLTEEESVLLNEFKQESGLI